MDAHRGWHGVQGGEEDGEGRVGDAAGGVRGEGAGGGDAERGHPLANAAPLEMKST